MKELFVGWLVLVVVSNLISMVLSIFGKALENDKHEGWISIFIAAIVTIVLLVGILAVSYLVGDFVLGSL